MREIAEVKPADDYRLEITFDDGTTVVANIKPRLNRPGFRMLQDEKFFRQVEIDNKFDGVKWPNGPDICVDWIEAEICRQEPLKTGFA